MVASVVLGVGLLVAVAAPGAGADRLDRFRELAVGRLGAVEDTGVVLDAAVEDEIDAILDAEVLDSLESGGLFATPAFIRERLDAFGEAWGGASLRVEPFGGGFLVGRFVLSTTGVGNSVRLYGRDGGRPALLKAWREHGVPEMYPGRSGPGGPSELVVAWAGPATGTGSRPLRLELWRAREGRISSVWRSADRYPDGLWVWDADIAPGRILLRRELRYPGWKPGCDAQALEEDEYRWAPGGAVVVRQRVFNAGHRELQREVVRLFAALAAADARTVASIVPDASLRKRLPAGLSADPACDAWSPQTPGTAAVAAAAPGTGRSRVPWTLSWSRTRSGWRLRSAAPVLE